MCQRDGACLHATHREAGHGPMRLIGHGAEVRVYERNEVFEERLLEGTEVEVSSRSATGGIRRASRSRVRSSWTAGKWIAAKFHRDDERLCFCFGEQVIQDETSVALPAPASFIFASAVLQEEHRIAPTGVLVITRRRVNESVPVGVTHFREVMKLAKLAVGHVLERIKLRILRRDLDGTSPTSSAIIIVAVRIGNFGSIDIDGVVMKAFIQGTRVAGPSAVRIFGEGAAILETDAHALGFGRDDAEFHSAFRVDLRILFAGLIGWRRFPVIDWWFILGCAESTAQNGRENEEREFCFHISYLLSETLLVL